MAEEEKKVYNKGPWWKEGVKLMSDVSTWIVVPIVGALVFGKYMDGRFGTEPVIFLVLAGFGFLVTGYGIFKIVRDYMKKLKKTERNGNE
ncbi:AtpZ/AtpI family protein [Candidatus Nomurabacteria bacterium]|nr:AtpZ/AtpI family protein [Candidatus Nomurabacteria bacterium]